MCLRLTRAQVSQSAMSHLLTSIVVYSRDRLRGNPDDLRARYVRRRALGAGRTDSGGCRAD